MKRLKQSQVSEYRKVMLHAQGGKCAFCGQDCKKPCLDHAHMEPYKEKIRGVICNWCNIAIGKLENARVRTGTSWEEFYKTFHKVWEYVHGVSMDEEYENADWHPSKRKSEVTEFRKMKALEQYDVLTNMMDDDSKVWPTQFYQTKNATERVALFKKLNSKT